MSTTCLHFLCKQETCFNFVAIVRAEKVKSAWTIWRGSFRANWLGEFEWVGVDFWWKKIEVWAKKIFVGRGKFLLGKGFFVVRFFVYFWDVNVSVVYFKRKSSFSATHWCKKVLKKAQILIIKNSIKIKTHKIFCCTYFLQNFPGINITFYISIKSPKLSTTHWYSKLSKLPKFWLLKSSKFLCG